MEADLRCGCASCPALDLAEEYKGKISQVLAMVKKERQELKDEAAEAALKLANMQGEFADFQRREEALRLEIAVAHETELEALRTASGEAERVAEEHAAALEEGRLRIEQLEKQLDEASLLRGGAPVSGDESLRFTGVVDVDELRMERDAALELAETYKAKIAQLLAMVKKERQDLKAEVEEKEQELVRTQARQSEEHAIALGESQSRVAKLEKALDLLQASQSESQLRVGELEKELHDARISLATRGDDALEAETPSSGGDGVTRDELLEKVRYWETQASEMEVLGQEAVDQIKSELEAEQKAREEAEEELMIIEEKHKQLEGMMERLLKVKK